MHLRLRICDGAHIATRPPGEQEDRLIPGPPWLSGATFTWLPEEFVGGSWLPAEQNTRRKAGLYRAAAGDLLLNIYDDTVINIVTTTL